MTRSTNIYCPLPAVVLLILGLYSKEGEKLDTQVERRKSVSLLVDALNWLEKQDPILVLTINDGCKPTGVEVCASYLVTQTST